METVHKARDTEKCTEVPKLYTRVAIELKSCCQKQKGYIGRCNIEGRSGINREQEESDCKW
jgi:hypothetical protein